MGGVWHQVYHLVYHPPTRRWWGRSRLNVSRLEGSDARPGRARDGRRVARGLTALPVSSWLSAA